MAMLADGERQSVFAPPKVPGDGFLGTLLDANASAAAIVLLAGLPVLAAAWALLSPDRVLSHAMTWDLLFNLSGAWHLHLGHVAHVDFHEPVGQLNFLLTAAGFRLFGPSPFAFLAGVAMVAFAVFLAASLATWRRLPLLPASIFVIFVSLLVLMPANVGDRPNTYTFAMSYNRYCWSAFSILALIVFLPPRNGRGSDWVDIAVGGLLLVGMFYLKITYFAAGLAAVALAVLSCPHVRKRWLGWAAVGGIVVANAAAPYNHPYLLDIWGSAQNSPAHHTLGVHLNNFFAAAAEYAPYVAALVVAFWMWWTGRAPLRLLAAVGFLFAVSLFLLTQNTQAYGLPAAIVITFLLYDQFRARTSEVRKGDTALLLLALMIFPLFSIGASAMSLAGYHVVAGRDRALHVVDQTNLRGLAVPAEQRGVFASFARSSLDYPLRNRTGAAQPRYELSQYEYVEILMEAAALFTDGQRRPGGIALFEQVNPLPFMLGLVPPRGGNLWSIDSAPMRPDEEFFADVDHVLIPKFSISRTWTETMLTRYTRYLSEHYRHAAETPSWILLSRHSPVVSPPVRPSQANTDVMLGVREPPVKP